jgi:hypothetical protein
MGFTGCGALGSLIAFPDKDNIIGKGAAEINEIFL